MKISIFCSFIIVVLSNSILPISYAQVENSNKTITIGFVSDVHADMIPDVPERLKMFIEEASRNKADMIIQMGDFCRPGDKDKNVFEIWNAYSGPKYHVLGNHDLDFNTKQEVIDYWGIPFAYYSFDFKGFHIIVLDANFLYQNGEYIDYANANYYVSSEQRAYIPPEQIEWLKKDLEKTDKQTLVFSHQSLINTFWGIKNQIEIQEVLESANHKAGYKKILACFNGHDHIDFHREINGIHYFEINSLAYQWIGSGYSGNTCNISDSTSQFTHLDKVAVYKDPLFAILKIENGILEIKGIQSEWECSSPLENGIPKGVHGAKNSPKISNYKFKINQ